MPLHTAGAAGIAGIQMSAPGPQAVAALVHWEAVQVEARRIGGIDIEDPCFAL